MVEKISTIERSRQSWSHAEVDPEIESGLVESEPDIENCEVVLSWEGGGIPRSLTSVATQARSIQKS